VTNPLAALYAFWMTTPAPVREPIRSAVVSVGWGAWTAICTLLGTAVQSGHAGDPSSTLNYLAANAWGAFIGFLIGSGGSATFRAMQAKTRVANTISLSDGTTAVITKAGPQ
jgi:hypothetical protein